MDRLEALTRLGLDEFASRDHINDAWRNAMKAVHPDSGTAPDPAMTVLLNEARTVALGALPNGNGAALVPIETVMDLVRARPEPGPTSAQRAAEQTFTKVVMHHVGGLAYRKRQRVILASVTAGVTALLGLGAAFGRFGYDTEMWKAVLGGFTAAGAALSAGIGIVAWRVSAMERTLKLDLAETAETLSDRTAYIDVLDEIGLGEFWSRQELLDVLGQWDVPTDAGVRRVGLLGTLFGPPYRAVPLAHTAAEIGPVDFARLLTTKGVELELVEERRMERSDGRTAYGYARRN